jgi:hypothetical protein
MNIYILVRCSRIFTGEPEMHATLVDRNAADVQRRGVSQACIIGREVVNSLKHMQDDLEGKDSLGRGGGLVGSPLM